MIYFLVNNDYQLFDARRHVEALRRRGLEAALIEVPHALRESNRERGFTSVVTFESPWRSHGWPGAWPRYVAAAHEVQRGLQPQREDTLFMYTEYELINHFVALRFKRRNALVFLLEDGGIGTYLPFSLPGDEPLSVKELVVAALTRTLPGLGRTRFHKVNGVVFPWLEDECVDGVCLYRPLHIVRALPVHVLIGARANPVDRCRSRVVFLNERMYDNYQTADQYLDGLQRILTSLSRGFDEVIFKFHPREERAWTDRIRAMLGSQHPAIRIVDDRRAIETMVTEVRPEVIASYFSTPLLNLEGTGIEPMFLYQLLPELASQKLFKQLTALLNQWNYHFVSSWGEARSGYRCGMAPVTATEPLALADLVTTGPR